MKDTYQQVLAHLQSLIAEINTIDAEDISPEDSLEEDLAISISSKEFSQVLLKINNAFEIKISYELVVRNEIETVSDLVSLIVEEIELG